MNVHRIVVRDCFCISLFTYSNLLFSIDLESISAKKETIRKKPLVKKKNNYTPHYPQSTQMLPNSHPPMPPPPSYNAINCYQQPFYGQYPLPTPYSHVEHFQPSPPSTSQCEMADQELYFPISYPSFSL